MQVPLNLVPISTLIKWWAFIPWAFLVWDITAWSWGYTLPLGSLKQAQPYDFFCNLSKHLTQSSAHSKAPKMLLLFWNMRTIEFYYSFTTNMRTTEFYWFGLQSYCTTWQSANWRPNEHGQWPGCFWKKGPLEGLLCQLKVYGYVDINKNEIHACFNEWAKINRMG